MGLARKPLSFVIYHRDENIADLEFKRFHMNATQDSPFFKVNSKNLKIQVLTSGYMSQRGLGSDVILTIMGGLISPTFYKLLEGFRANQHPLQRGSTTKDKTLRRLRRKYSLTMSYVTH